MIAVGEDAALLSFFANSAQDYTYSSVTSKSYPFIKLWGSDVINVSSALGSATQVVGFGKLKEQLGWSNTILKWLCDTK